MTDFEQALKKLCEDPNYRQAVIEDWRRLANDHKDLSTQEFLLLLQVWNATGGERTLKSAVMCCCCCTNDPTRPT